MAGYLEVFYGPMFSGKTDALLTAVHRYKIAGRSCICLQVGTDTRDGVGLLKSRAGAEHEARVVSPDALPDALDAEVIALDEAQFVMPDVLIPQVLQWVEAQHKIVLVAGLNLTFQRRPFGGVPQLVMMADRTHQLRAVCRDCRVPSTAIYTWRDPSAGAAEVVIGSDLYVPVCRAHYLERCDK